MVEAQEVNFNIRRGNFVFQKAEEIDIDAMVSIENDFFGSYSRKFDEDAMTKWFKHNPDMFYTVKNNEGRVLAFTILAPVSKGLSDTIESGELGDLFDFPEAEVPKIFQSDYFYIADICVRNLENKMDYIRISSLLISGMINIIHEKAKYVLTLPVTEKGLKISEHIGFKKTDGIVKSENAEYAVYKLIVTEKRYQELDGTLNRGVSR